MGLVGMSEGAVMSVAWYASAQTSVGCPILRTTILGHKRELAKCEPSRKAEAALHNHGFLQVPDLGPVLTDVL